MLPTLHVPTLLLSTALAVAVAGVLLLLASGRGQAWRAFSLWGAAMLTGSLGLALLVLAVEAGRVAEIAGMGFIIAGTALSWAAARCFTGRAPLVSLMAMGPAVFLASALGRDASGLLSTAAALIAGGAYTMAAAMELWRGRASTLRTRDAAMVLLAIHGTLHLVRGVSLLFAPGHPALALPVLTVALTLEALVHAVAMALLLLALMQEHKLAASLEEARELALLDGLTGLGNRRHFDESLERETGRALREERPLALLMIDADHFKLINDVFGHQAGDDCLRELAVAIRGATRRPADVVSRFGGEEFAVLLPGTDKTGAEAVAATIHDAIATKHMEHPGSPCGRVTVSIGVAVLTPGRGSGRPSSLLRAADSALYAAKALGRNRTELAGIPAATPWQPA